MHKVCSLHNYRILSVCFFRGCHYPLLCKKCLVEHPKEHDLDTYIKDVADLIAEEGWIEDAEKSRDSELLHLENLSIQKKNLFVESEKVLREWVKSITSFLEDKLCKWMKELHESMNFNDQSEIRITFSKLEENIEALKDFSFKMEDVFEKVNKMKMFNEDILPNSKILKDNAKEALNRWTIDQKKLEKYKDQFTEPLKNLSFKDFLLVESFQNLNVYEKVASLEQECQILKEEKLKSIDNLKTIIQNLEKENLLLQEKISLSNKDISILKSEITSLLASNEKLKQHELDRISHKMILENESRILNDMHLAKLEEWIPKPSSPAVCKLNLIYRATRDGFKCASFYQKCSSSFPTISFIKSKVHGRIFGGYTTKKWEANSGYIEDKEAFIFSLTHNEKYPCKDPKNAIYGGNTYMVCFGGGGDIYISDDSNVNITSYTNFPYKYECPHFSSWNNDQAKSYLAGSIKFSVEEIEVYQVTWM